MIGDRYKFPLQPVFSIFLHDNNIKLEEGKTAPKGYKNGISFLEFQGLTVLKPPFKELITGVLLPEEKIFYILIIAFEHTTNR